MKSLRDIKREFVRFNAEDMLILQEKSLEFKSLSLNDSIWVRVSDVLKEFEENKGIQLEKSEISKANIFLEFENESDVFYFYSKDFLKRNDEAPLSYVRPTIEQIFTQQEKNNISKIIDKEITKDATKNMNLKSINLKAIAFLGMLFFSFITIAQVTIDDEDNLLKESDFSPEILKATKMTQDGRLKIDGVAAVVGDYLVLESDISKAYIDMKKPTSW